MNQGQSNTYSTKKQAVRFKDMILQNPSVLKVIKKSLPFLMTTSLAASGNQIHEQSASVMGMSTAGQATWIGDASTSFYNPAGLSRLKGSHFSLNVGYVDINGKSDLQGNLGGNDGGNPGVDMPYATLFSKFELPGSWDLGLCLVGPYGLSVDYDNGYTGRALIEELDFTAPQLNPSLSYTFNDRFSMGFGIGLQYATLETRQDIGARADRDYDSLDLGYNIGLMYDTQDARIGFAYRSKISHDMKGELETGGTKTDSSVTITTPASWNLSYFRDFGFIHGYFDVGQTLWNVTQETSFNDGGTITSIPRKFDDAWRVAAGMEIPLNHKVDIRCGISWDENVVPDAYRAPDVIFDDQFRYSLGFNYQYSQTSSLDFAYQYADLGKNKTDLDAADFLGIQLEGEVKAVWHMVAMQWNRHF